MRAIKLICLFAVTLASLPLRAQPVGPVSQPGTLATNRPPLYETEVKHVAGLDLIPTDFAYVTCGTNRFGFVLPAGYRLEREDPAKVTLVSADFNCLLTFRVLESLPPGTTELDPARYRDLALSRRRGGKILDESSQAAVNSRGPAFELRWNAAGAVPRRERVVFIPSNAGVLEFDLVTSLERFEAGQRAFHGLLRTFRAAQADGRLEMPVFSNRF